MDLCEKIKKEFSNMEFSYVSEKESYDFLLVISGCHIKCANIKNYKYKKIINIDSDNYKNYRNIIENIICKYIK